MPFFQRYYEIYRTVCKNHEKWFYVNKNIYAGNGVYWAEEQCKNFVIFCERLALHGQSGCGKACGKCEQLIVDRENDVIYVN